MTNLYVIEKINDLIGAFMLIYFFNKSMQPKNKKYNSYDYILCFNIINEDECYDL